MKMFFQVRVSIPSIAGSNLERTFCFRDRHDAEAFTRVIEQHPAGVKVLATSINHLVDAAEAVDEIDEEINLDAQIAYSELK